MLLVAGSFFVVFGFMMLSICKEFWQAMLAQGFCIGLGGGMLFVPSVAILPTYFSTKIGLAIGLAASGSSMGGKLKRNRPLHRHSLIILQVLSTLLSSTACCRGLALAGPSVSWVSWHWLLFSFPSSS